LSLLLIARRGGETPAAEKTPSRQLAIFQAITFGRGRHSHRPHEILSRLGEAKTDLVEA